MLTIQRASAGSGKTFTLARNFILHLIAFKDAKGNLILRDKRQIEDALNHILAITFTNKATNEMKGRIILNLSLLAKAKEGGLTEKEAEKIPYLLDFKKAIGVSIKEIGMAADNALKITLNNYSLFKISTIDSFFQEILRTFVYEANINDNYQLEIDSAFVNDAALDEAINELDINPRGMGNAAFWLKRIINEEASKTQKWNPFNKKATANSVYAKLRGALLQLESEEYKKVKEILDLYFALPEARSRLLSSFLALEDAALKERKQLFDELQKIRIEAQNLMQSSNYPESYYKKGFAKHLNKVANLKIDDKEVDFQYANILKKRESVFMSKYKGLDGAIESKAMEFYEKAREWENPSPDSFFKNWKVYGPLLPYLGLIVELKTFISQVLESNNLIQISDTSYILKKIIGHDDSPFVYERIGNRIDNYLIDEFQDTSQMQWDVIYPLLNESEAKGGNSLIIGDPKQSIYRFRNADHNLIMKVVPDAFPGYIEAGFSKEDNTNWRSHTRIVKFNNYFFKKLAEIISDVSKKNGIPTDFKALYSNVVQYPQNQEGKGYVEIRFFDKPKEESSDENKILGGENISSEGSKTPLQEGSGLVSEDFMSDDDVRQTDQTYDWFDSTAMDNLGPLVTSLLNRGYRQKDIGILVNTNERGAQVVEALVGYNQSLPGKVAKIDFISEESLLISSSPAVEIILGLMERLSNPTFYSRQNSGALNSEETTATNTQKYYNWNKLKFAYNIFALKNANLSLLEKITAFLDQEIFEEHLTSLIESLPTPSLSSLVETIIDTFLDDDLRKTEAIYLSSFQDIINEYCASHHDDPASFLEWWNSRGTKMSISSPEGIDAVQIMTIHKSKGLEFKCVIIPFATDFFTPGTKDEWRWVATHHIGNLNLPPVLPVKTTSELGGSHHEAIYKEYYDQVLTDKLNMYYVAFTRARNELYVFTKKPDKKSQSFPEFLTQILKPGSTSEPADVSVEESPSDMSENLCVSSDFEIQENPEGTSQNEMTITYGQRLTTEEIEKESEKESKEKVMATHSFETYYVNKRRPRLRSAAYKLLPSSSL